MTLLLLICAALMERCGRAGNPDLQIRVKRRLGIRESAKGPAGQHAVGSFLPLFTSHSRSHLLASFVTTLTGWQFKAVAKQFLVNKDALAILFGNFYLTPGYWDYCFSCC